MPAASGPAALGDPGDHGGGRRVLPGAAHLVEVVGGLADAADEAAVLGAGLLAEFVANLGGHGTGLVANLGSDARWAWSRAVSLTSPAACLVCSAACRGFDCSSVGGVRS